MSRNGIGYPMNTNATCCLSSYYSCQGEERSTIFYSLVATPGQDALNYICRKTLRRRWKKSLRCNA